MSQIKFESIFQLPIRELKALSFSKADRLSVEQWVRGLPTADMAQSTRLLYMAIKEVCELNCSAATRMEITQALQPAISLALEGLERKYLNQHIILPVQPKKIAALCHALQNYLATAYIISACQASDKMGSLFKKPSALMSRAIYHALVEYSGLLIRNYQLYKPETDRFWKNSHRLYQMAVKYKLEKIPQQLAGSDNSYNIEHAYMYLLLWGSVKANQLRQEDINKLKKPIWQWASLAHLVAVDPQQESVFVIDPNSDMPPVYQKFYKGKLSPLCSSMDTTQLVAKLKEIAGPLQQKKTGLSQNLINHLILAWGLFTSRTFMRLEASSRLMLCVGLTAVHYFLSDESPFDRFVYGDDKKQLGIGTAQFKTQRSQKEKLDVWDASIFGTDQRSEAQVTMESIDYHIRTGGNSMMTLTGSDKEKYQHFVVDVVNISPGGYCLKWGEEAPASIRAGEIIGIKEDLHQHWNVGIIRWVRQSKEKSLQIGVELLSPNAEPYAVRLADYEGKAQSDFTRAIILPEIKTSAVERSVLLPTVTFKAGQYVLLARAGQEDCVQLKKQLSSTGGYSQFTYQAVNPLAQTSVSGNNASLDAPHNDLDDVWELL